MKNEIEKILAEYSDGKETIQEATTKVLRLFSDSKSMLPSEVKLVATRFAYECRLKGVSTNNDTVMLYDKWINNFLKNNMLD